MRTDILLPSGPGAYAEWPTLVGVPTPWEAARDLDGKYIASAVAGQRHSFPVTLPVPAIANDETLVSAVYRAYVASPSPSSPLLQDPGFEIPVPNPYWTLDAYLCAINGATIPAGGHSGSRMLQIASSSVGPKCGQATQTVTGFIPGRSYQCSLWWNRQGISTGRNVLIAMGGVIIGTISGVTLLAAPWQLFVCPTLYVATGTSANLSISVPAGTSPVTFNSKFDDISLAIVPQDSIVTPFYRLFGIDTDLAPWTIPTGQTAFLAQDDRPIALYGYQLRDGGLELGVRNENGVEVWLDQARLDVSLRFQRDSMGFVGGL